MRDWLILLALAVTWLAASSAVGYWIFTKFPVVRQFSVSTRFTAGVIVAIPLGLGLLDVALYATGGNDATISKVMLSVRSSRPLVALSTAYSFGVLLGHFFFPTFVEDASTIGDVLGRMLVVLSPTGYALFVIGLGNGTLQAHKVALETGGQIAFASYMTGLFVLGGIAGKYVLPQHLILVA